MFPAMACGSAVMVLAPVSKGSLAEMLKLGRRVGLVCEKLTASQACAAKSPEPGLLLLLPLLPPLPLLPGLAQALAAAAAGVEMPGLPN
jgi:hypothetical protein